MFSYLKQEFLNSLENIDNYLNREETLRKFEFYNLNDEHVFYICVYIVVTLCLFVTCALTNFYQIRVKVPKSVFKSKPEQKQSSSKDD